MVLAIEITPSAPTQWSANYYSAADTPSGRRVEITTVLHRQLLSPSAHLEGPTRWLMAATDDPADRCYSGYPRWGTELAAGYAAALAVHEAEAIACPRNFDSGKALRQATTAVVPGQLSEWLLTDLDTAHA